MSIDWQQVSEADCLGMLYTAGGLVDGASLADLWPSIKQRVEERNLMTATRLFAGYAGDMLEQASIRFLGRLRKPPPLEVEEGVKYPLSSYHQTILKNLRRDAETSDLTLGGNAVLFSPPGYGDSPDPRSPDPSDEVEKRDDAETIWKEIAQLCDLDKTIMVEVFFYGTSQQELARRLGLSSRAVYDRIKKCCERLARRLRRKGF